MPDRRDKKREDILTVFQNNLEIAEKTYKEVAMYDIILVPLDGSKRAETIINHVTELAKKFNSKLVLLTVIEPQLLRENVEMAAASMGDFRTLAEDTKKAETYLAGLQQELIENNIQTEIRIVPGLPVPVIKETAEKENANLIAIASHGRGGLARVFYGSVAAAILSQIDRPLLLIRSQEIKE